MQFANSVRPAAAERAVVAREAHFPLNIRSGEIDHLGRGSRFACSPGVRHDFQRQFQLSFCENRAL